MATHGDGTPVAPRFKILCPNNEEKNPIPSQSQYRSFIDMILYLIKHSRPDWRMWFVKRKSPWMMQALQYTRK
jgi:hypothetical protein